MVTADRDRISQVITNLLSNSIKYSSGSAPVEITCRSNSEAVTICVSDKVYGITDQDGGHVFDRFYRVASDKMATFPGMGLGLFISAEIVKPHNGKT